MSKEKKVLMIAYSYPPSGMPGVYRTLGFVKHLPENGWHPIVLTVPEDSYFIKDFSLLNNIPKEVKVVRIPYWGGRIQKFLTKKKEVVASAGFKNSMQKTNNLVKKRSSILNTIIKWISIPDNMNRWILNAYLAGKKIINRENINLIWSTSPDDSAHLIAYFLKRKFRIPWIADFRDPWISPFIDNKNSLWKKINEFLESEVLNNADTVVTVSNKLREDLILRYPRINPQKILVITNGFEEENLNKEKYYPTDKFTITDTGRFYGKRTPTSFLLALKQAFLENPEMEKETRVRFIGTFEGNIKKEVKKLRIEDKIEIIPQVPHQECIKYQCRSDILLLIPGPNTLTMPGKIFEYLAAKRPILALAEEGSDSAALIRETKSGAVVNPSDTFQIKNTLLDLFDKYKNGTLNSAVNPLRLKGYTRFSLTKKLVLILDKIYEDKFIEENEMKKENTFNSEIIKNFFSQDSKSYLYNRWLGSPIARADFQITRDILLKNLSLCDLDRVLEIGCGPGIWTAITSSIAKEVVAIDISKNMITEAKKRINNDNIIFENIDFQEYETNKKFTKIFSVRVIEYFKNEEKVIEKIYKLLENSGRAVIITKSFPSIWMGRTRILNFVCSLGTLLRSKKEQDKNQIKLWQERKGFLKLSKLMRQTGFKKIKIFPVILRPHIFKSSNGEYPIISKRYEKTLLRFFNALTKISWKIPQPLRYLFLFFSETYLISGVKEK